MGYGGNANPVVSTRVGTTRSIPHLVLWLLSWVADVVAGDDPSDIADSRVPGTAVVLRDERVLQHADDVCWDVWGLLGAEPSGVAVSIACAVYISVYMLRTRMGLGRRHGEETDHS